MIILRRLSTASTSVVVAGLLTGDKNGTNKTFTTTYNYKSDRVSVYFNGQALHTPGDFNMTGDNTIEFIYLTPEENDTIRATYEVQSTVTVAAPIYTPLSGITTIPSGVQFQTVNFGTILDDTNYIVNIDLISTDSNPSIYSFVVAEKTTSNFKVYFSGDIDTSNYTLEWAVLE